MEDRGEIAARLDLALELAREAQRFILARFSPGGCRGGFDSKADGSPVTEADRGAEELIRARLERAFADDGVIGEEHGARAGQSAFRWILDPIDGTKSFVHGVPLFGTLIGVQRRVAPGETDPLAVAGWRSVAGVANLPALDERVWGSLGGGAWHRSRLGADGARPARVSTVARLQRATVGTTCLTSAMRPEHRRWFAPLCERAALARGWSDCYGTMLVATGQIDAMVDPPMKLWDVAALDIIIHEAGGRLTGFDGRPSDGSAGAVATNGLIHDEVLGVLNP